MESNEDVGPNASPSPNQSPSYERSPNHERSPTEDQDQKPELPDLTIRRATLDDLPALRELPLVYFGHDYFQHVVADWLADARRTVLVALDGEHVVGVDSLVRADGGQRALSQALRVHPEWRGRGVSGALAAAARATARSLEPPPAAMRAVLAATPATRRLHARQGYAPVTVDSGARYAMSAGALVALARALRAAGVSAVAAQSVEREQFVAANIGVGICLSDWVPFERSLQGIVDVERITNTELRFFRHESIWATAASSRGGNECYCSIYGANGDIDGFLRMVLFLVEFVEQQMPDAHYFNVQWPSDEETPLDVAKIEQFFERDEFNKHMTEIEIMDKPLNVDEMPTNE